MKSATLHHQLSERFETLVALRDGWLEGKGIAPDKRKLREIGGHMTADYPQQVPPPAIVATPEGNLLFEWALPGDPSVDLDLDTMRAAFHVFLPSQKEIEREFRLMSDEAWEQFFAFLSSTLEQHEA